MKEKENIRFFRLLTDGEEIKREFSPLNFGLSKKSAKRIFDAFCVQLLDKPLKIQRHEGINSRYFRIKTDYLINREQKTYCLTVEIPINKRVMKNDLTEYFYFKFISLILFRENRKILTEN